MSEIRNRRKGIEITSGPQMGETERNEWEERKQAFIEQPPPHTPEVPARGRDIEIEPIVKAVIRGLQRMQIQEPLDVHDLPASNLIPNVYDNVGWNAVAVAPAVQRVDTGAAGRIFFWCYMIGAPAVITWLTPGKNIQAAFGAVVGYGIALDGPSAVGVYDGASWRASVGPDVEFWVSSGAAGARLMVIEGVVR